MQGRVNGAARGDVKGCDKATLWLVAVPVSARSERRQLSGCRRGLRHTASSVNPRFLDQISSLNITTQETARESNPIATALNSLFRAYRQALEADRNSTADHVVKSNKDAFLERYQIEFEEEDVIRGVLARDLFVALRRVAKEFNLSFPMTSVQQFAQRFSNDLAAVREAGFEITINELRNRVRTYDIRRAKCRPL